VTERERQAGARMSVGDCSEFERWLDQGRPASSDRLKREHAAGCARCSAQLSVALELDAALEEAPSAAPAALTERVMARVAAMRPHAPGQAARSQSAHGSPDGFATPALEWWVRAAADPASALALALSALLLWRAETLVTLARMASGWLTHRLQAAPAPTISNPFAALEHLMPHGVVALALALAMMPALAWGSWRLCLWAERNSLPAQRLSLTQH
jgi:hypothetical protein